MKKITTIILIGLINAFNLCNICFAQYTKIFDFDTAGVVNGNMPKGSLVSDGIFLYGMTMYGGSGSYYTNGYYNYKCGVIFKIKPDGTGYSKLFNFDSISGSYPRGSLIFDSTFLCGMTSYGGLNKMGTIFKIKADGTGYFKLLDFDSINGSYPWGSLVKEGTFLYGMTREGGIYNHGVIFKIKPNGTGYAKLLDFSGVANGSYPSGSLISDGNFLYGMTQVGGTHDTTSYGGDGTIFKIKPDGTGYSMLHDFGSMGDGGGPQGSLIFDGTFLYGMTTYGNTNGGGIFFKIKPDGTGYTKLFDFDQPSNPGSIYHGQKGSHPLGTPFFDGSFLYGMASDGGPYCEPTGCGTIFKIKTDGTEYSLVLGFSGVNGDMPYGNLISDGTFLYGTTSIGGTNDNGILFKLGIATAGISENNMAKDFSLYPNPTNGAFTISTKENGYMLIITNVLGEKIYQSEIKNEKSEIDLSKQPRGIYFAKIYYEGKNHLEKIIVQ